MSFPLAPICIFVHSRLDLVQQTVATLLANSLAGQSILYIFCDGAKPGQEATVKAVREYAHKITGFNRVFIHENPTNQGLACSIISGVSMVLKEHERVIVLEDDLLLSTGFLHFMNQALEAYASNVRILSISGYSLPIRFPADYAYDAAFGLRASSWGWAIWRDRWEMVDWEVKDFTQFMRNPLQRLRFNQGGTDLSGMLIRQKKGLIDSWAIRFCYHQFRHGLVDVFPVKSLVENIGWGDAASHCRENVQGWRSVFWQETPEVFQLPKDIVLSPDILRQFRSFNGYFARSIRLWKRLLLSVHTARERHLPVS